MNRLTLAVLLSLAAPAVAQPPKAFTQTRRPGDVETDPIRCFWKTDRSSIIVGERFTLVLTCGIIDTDAIKAVPDFNQLEPSTIGLLPFEVVKGVRHEDIKSAPWRYIQYEYTVRTIAEGLFDKDLNIPPVKITYHIQSSIGGGSTGRDQTYQLPPMPMRIASLVPAKNTDIRDAASNTFADIENRRVRATGEFVAAAIAFGFAVVLLALAAVRVFGRYRVRTPAAERPLSLSAVLGGVLREARRVKADASGGWTPELVSRALTVLRIGGAVALGRPVAQAIVDTHVAPREGQLALRKGLIGSRRSLVSNATTAETIARTMANANGRGPSARTAALLKEFEESLSVLSTARYGRSGTLDSAVLDGAFDNGINALQQLRSTKRWPMRMVGSVARLSTEVGWS
ncbi:MAG TPA: hypothetical protein VLV86_02165 [Vicinamibacterales bacterium]|nr:hypothetical protein [Vicinamibacterales bacterium]